MMTDRPAPPFYTEAELIGMLHLAGIKHADHDLIRRIRPIMVGRNEAWQVGQGKTRPWVYSTFAPAPWSAYFLLRQQKIAAGEWAQRRAYMGSDIPQQHEPTGDV